MTKQIEFSKEIFDVSDLLKKENAKLFLVSEILENQIASNNFKYLVFDRDFEGTLHLSKNNEAWNEVGADKKSKNSEEKDKIEYTSHIEYFDEGEY